MIGAIIGDIAGSRYEYHNHKNKDFKIFHPADFMTDDSYMTIALAKAVEACEYDLSKLEGLTVKWMREFGNRYPDCGFGGMFKRWLWHSDGKPYGSFGNGAAMRVSAAGFYGRTLDEVKEISRIITGVTHNHPEGLKGAEATAVCIYLARMGKTKEEIRKFVEENYYMLDFTIDGIRDSYYYDVTCMGTVPQAIEVFLEAESFEDCVRLGVSLGGDCDTLTAIACSMAEAFYGVPDNMKAAAMRYMDGYTKGIFEECERTK